MVILSTEEIYFKNDDMNNRIREKLKIIEVIYNKN